MTVFNPPADLPVSESLPELRTRLAAASQVLLHAPPGAGKTTVVPPALLAEPWLRGRRILVLEPRRIAARAAAARVAELLGDRVGGVVGYRTRLETRVSAATRIEFLTEGLLARRLQHDPTLDGIGAVIFDEFHERHLTGDLALALALDAQRQVRPDLKLIVMSATLAVAALQRLLPQAATVACTGRMFPVAIRHLPETPDDYCAAAVATIRRALSETAGDILVFLPGIAAIRRVQQALTDLPAQVVTLFGDLAADEQDAVLRPGAHAARRVILATPLAETSVTVPGVSVVIDSGWQRQPRYEPAREMTRLATVRVSKANAEQRAGRAGRLGPGVCYRLWSAGTQHALLEHPEPEMLQADLAPLALELAAWGVADPATLTWLDPPPAGAFARARATLAALGAVEVTHALEDATDAVNVSAGAGHDAEESLNAECGTDNSLHSKQDSIIVPRACDAGEKVREAGESQYGRITRSGRQLAALPLHPRLAAMLLFGAARGQGALAADIAALLAERDILARADNCDLAARLAVLHACRRGRRPHDCDRNAVAAVVRVAAQLHLLLRDTPLPNGIPLASDDDTAGILLAHAYPERLGKRREPGNDLFLLAGGRGARLRAGVAFCGCEFIVAADIDSGQRDSIIHLAAGLSAAAVRIAFADRICWRERVFWSDRDGDLVATRAEMLDALVLCEGPWEKPDPAAATAALLTGIRARGLAALPWREDDRQWQQRVLCLRTWLPDGNWPDVSDEWLLANLEQWLAPSLAGITRFARLAALDLAAALNHLLDYRQRQQLAALAPTHITVPTGSSIRLRYALGQAPVLAVRLQEMFGCVATPCVAGGRVKVLLQLLSPAHRPVQVTDDLAGFWSGSYAEVRRELRGRYPKHVWPDDPRHAAPTRRAKPRPQ